MGAVTGVQQKIAANTTMAGTLVMAPKSVTFRQHDHLVSVLFGDLFSHSYNITFSMFFFYLVPVDFLFFIGACSCPWFNHEDKYAHAPFLGPLKGVLYMRIPFLNKETCLPRVLTKNWNFSMLTMFSCAKLYCAIIIQVPLIN